MVKSNKKTELKGLLNKKIVEFFDLKDNQVFIGEQNVNHIKDEHYDDYEKYFEYVPEIIHSPDYVGRNLRNNSIELIRKFFSEEKKIYVKVAVRVSKRGILYVRTLFVIGNSEQFEYHISQGYYKKVQNL